MTAALTARPIPGPVRVLAAAICIAAVVSGCGSSSYQYDWNILVDSIIRPDRLNEVLESLYRAEVRGISVSRVQGHGGELDRVETYRGTTVKIGLSDKVRFEIAVSEPFVEATIEALVEGARTGEVGDGKIFVLPLERAIRIRTGETDHGAVTPVDS